MGGHLEPHIRAIVNRHITLETLPIGPWNVSLFEMAPMRKQYLHVSVHSCNKCQGPVVSASLAVRENAISKETDIRQAGAICLSCGLRDHNANGKVSVRHFPPMEWEPEGAADSHIQTTAFVKQLDRADLR